MNTVLKESLTFETSRIDMLERSERRAWIVAITAVMLCLIFIAAHYTLPPRVLVEPYVVRVDSVTGMTDVVTVMKDEIVVGNEALDKQHLAQYVIARESYNWHSQQGDYNKVGIMSAPDVAEQYLSKYTGEDAIQDVYRDKVTIEVDIISVVPSRKGEAGLGTVRFKTLTRKNSSMISASFVATIGYEYRTAERMPESIRIVNALGFTVLSYRVDAEIPGGTQ